MSPSRVAAGSDEEGSASPRPPSPARAAQKKKARRAILARSAPHLLDGESSSSSPLVTSPSAGGSRSPSASARASPGSEGDVTPSVAGGVSTAPRPSRSHAVPKGFRGPPPREGDAEDIAPPPSLMPTPGSSTLFLTSNTPTNRNGWRYIPAGPASAALPTSVYRTLEMAPAGVHWSWADRSVFTKISQDARVICSDRGFRSARVNVPVREGAWYCEMQILSPETLLPGVGAPGPLPAPMGDGAHVRLGWGRREAGLNAPTGFDGYSYGLRDTTGERVFLSRPAAYARKVQPGDTVGLYIRLPPISQQQQAAQSVVRRKRIPIRYKGQVYFESLEYAPSKEMEALMESSRKGLFRWPGSAPLSSASAQALISSSSAAAAQAAAGVEAAPGASSKKRRLKNQALPAAAADVAAARPLPTLGPTSRIGFFINGQPQGIAFEDLLDFRPLATLPSTSAGTKGKKGAASASTLGLATDDAVITSSSTLATIMKSRENAADDGALGYFAMASCFGGARVRLVTRKEEFAFPPPLDIEAALESANGEDTCALVTSCKDSAPAWRALDERFDEYLEEQWRWDEEDEVRAEAAWQVMRHKLDSDDDEDSNSAAEAATAAPRKKYRSHKRKGGQRERAPAASKQGGAQAVAKVLDEQAQTARDTMSPTPLRQMLFSSPGVEDGLGEEDAPGEEDVVAHMDWQHTSEADAEGEVDMQIDQ